MQRQQVGHGQRSGGQFRVGVARPMKPLTPTRTAPLSLWFRRRRPSRRCGAARPTGRGSIAFAAAEVDAPSTMLDRLCCNCALAGAHGTLASDDLLRSGRMRASLWLLSGVLMLPMGCSTPRSLRRRRGDAGRRTRFDASPGLDASVELDAAIRTLSPRMASSRSTSATVLGARLRRRSHGSPSGLGSRITAKRSSSAAAPAASRWRLAG